MILTGTIIIPFTGALDIHMDIILHGDSVSHGDIRITTHHGTVRTGMEDTIAVTGTILTAILTGMDTTTVTMIHITDLTTVIITIMITTDPVAFIMVHEEDIPPPGQQVQEILLMPEPLKAPVSLQQTEDEAAPPQHQVIPHPM